MSTPPTNRTLNSWKEIAAFLGVSVRTAQNWEQERGLPVRRLPGARGPVSIDLAELEAWRDSAREAAQPSIDTPVHRRRSLRIAAAVLVVVACSLGVYLAIGHTGRPALFRVEQNALIVTDRRGAEIWRRVFRDPLSVDMYVARFGNHQPQQPVRFDDLDGDGHIETLFLEEPVQHPPEGTVLHCFSDAGAEKWRFIPGRTVSTPGDAKEPSVYARPYSVQQFSVVPLRNGKGRGVVVSSGHAEYYPNQVALLSPRGELIREYWHSGGLSAMEIGDLNGDGRVKIYLGGVSNAYKQATLVVLALDDFRGASVETEHPAYQLHGFAPGNEIARILFPRTCISRKFQPFNYVTHFLMRPDSLTVYVGERQNAPILYHLGRDLSFQGAEFEFAFRALHAELASSRQLDHSLSSREEAELRNLRYLPVHP